MLLLKNSEFALLGALLSVLSSVFCGEVRVSSVVYDTVRLPCWFPFIHGVNNLIAVWEKKETDGKNVQIFKSVNGLNDLSNQDPQFRGRTDLSGDILKGNLDLTLSGVTMNDDGVYFCRAANRINHGDNTVILSVSPLPRQVMKSVAGGEVTLKLKRVGEPSEITWKLNTSKIVEKELRSPVPHFYCLDNKAVLNPDGSLTIRNLSREDSGVYKSEVLVKNDIQEAEITLIVLDRVSKPTITNISSSMKIHLICRSSTVNVTYRWLDKTRGKIVSTDLEYTASRPREDVELMCTVNDSISEESESITLLHFSDIRLPARHQIVAISVITSSLLFAIIAAVFFCHKEYWKIKRYKSVPRLCCLCTNHSKRSTHYGDTGSQKMKKDKRDTAEPTRSSIISLDKQQTTEGVHEPGFQKKEEDRRDATDDKRSRFLLTSVNAHQKSSDSDYFSEEATEEARLSSLQESPLFRFT